MPEPTAAYGSRPDNTLEAEISTLATVYRFVLDCHTKKEAAPESRPEDPERRSDEIRANSRIP